MRYEIKYETKKVMVLDMQGWYSVEVNVGGNSWYSAVQCETLEDAIAEARRIG